MSLKALWAYAHLDKDDPQSPVNNPDVQKVPFEPTMSASYRVLGSTKKARYFVTEIWRFPPDLWAKHKSILARSYYERIPDHKFDKGYAKLMDKLEAIEKDGKDPAQVPDEWIRDAAEIMPGSQALRRTYMRKLAPYQRAQFVQVWTLLEKTKDLRKPPVSKTTHTANIDDLTKLFNTPYPELAQQEFPKLPKTRREQWYDLALHYMKVAYLQDEAESLKQCFQKEHATNAYHHVKPCFGLAQRYQAGYKYWTYRNNTVGPCGYEVKQLRETMVDEPDFEHAAATWNRLQQCQARTNRHMDRFALRFHEPRVFRREAKWRQGVPLDAWATHFNLNWRQRSRAIDGKNYPAAVGEMVKGYVSFRKAEAEAAANAE
eukprot:UN04551